MSLSTPVSRRKLSERFDGVDLGERTGGRLAREPGEKAHDRRAVAHMRGAPARDLDRILDRLHQRDRIGPARDLAAGAGDKPRKCVGSGGLIEAHGLAGVAERRQVRREGLGRAHVGKRLELMTHVVRELAPVDIQRGPAFARDGRERERQRRMRDVGAADVEGPGHRMRVGHDQHVGFELPDLRAEARELGRRFLAGVADVVQHDRAERWRRPVVPDRVDRIGLGRRQRRAGGGAGLGEFFRALDRVQPRVVAESVAAGEILFQPLVRRRLDEMLDREQRSVDLLAHLQCIASIDEQCGAIHQHDRDAGGAGKAGEPGQPLLRGRHVFVLMPIGARHDEAREPAPRQLGTQRRQPRRAGGGLRVVIESLELGFEHRRTLCAAPRGGNVPACASLLRALRRGRFEKKAVTLHVSGSRVIKLGLDASDFLHLQMRLIHS